MEQEERLSAGPQSTQQPVPARWQRRRSPLGHLLRGIAGLVLLLVAGGAMAQTAGRDPHRIRTVVIDAGHGGKDPGAIGTGRYKTAEKDIALNVTLLAGRYITEAFPDVKVVYTRDTDHFVELMERSMIANRAKADLFISIHCNSNEKKDPVGAETFVMGLHKTEANMKVAMKENASILLEEGHELRYDGFNPKDPESIIGLSLRQNAHLEQSILFSSLVQTQFRERVGRPDRGVKQAGFLVISYTTMPAVLVELGFLSNPAEEDFLQGTQGQEYMSSAIYRAFKEYKAHVEGAGSPVVDAPVQKTDTARSAPVKEPKKEPVKEPAKAPEKANAEPDLVFKVQVATSSKRIPTKPQNFNGLEGVQEHQGGGMYKYTVGAEATVAGARRVQEACRAKGYTESFIVAFRNGERIAMQEALKLAGAR